MKLYVKGGFVDLHVHLREPGFEYKEDIKSGCEAAACGGFTMICCMPNTKPAIDCREVVEYVKEKASAVKGVSVKVIGAVTKGQMGNELADIEGMAEAGICAISEDGKSVMDSGLLREAMMRAKALGIPYFSHAEDTNLAGLPIGEELIVARDIMLAKETGCGLHICHVSTEGSAEIIRKAKACGMPVTAETAPHYFALGESDVMGNPNRKMNPPLRTARDVAAIRRALADGTIDAIATDHAPHAKFEKEVEFEKAPNGVIGLETSFAVSYACLVKTGVLTADELIHKMSVRPAEILGVELPEDVVVIDLDEEYVIGSAGFRSKSENSPFIGMKACGRVLEGRL